MRTEHLKYFLHLSQTGSIMQTSRELYTTHQNVSKMIRQLEDDLGTKLFTRSQKGVQLTPTGKLLLPVAKRAISDFGQLRADINRLEKREDLAGSLHILGASLSNFTLLSSIMQIFIEFYPSLRIRLDNVDPMNIMKQIALHPQLIGIPVVLSNPEFYDLYMPYIQQVHLTPLVQDTYYCVVSKQSPLAELKSISLAQFVQHPFATITLGEDEECLLTSLVSRYGGTVAFTSNSLPTYAQATQNARYVSISSVRTHQKYLERYPNSNTCLIPFQEDMRFTFSLAINLHAKLTESGQAFVDFIQNSQNYI